MNEIQSPLQAHVVQTLFNPGDHFLKGECLLVLEAMKMEHEICAEADGVLMSYAVGAGDWVHEGDELLSWHPSIASDVAVQVAANSERNTLVQPSSGAEPHSAQRASGAEMRADLARVVARRALLTDAARPQAIQKRHALGKLTARQYIEGLCDGGFTEYGAFAIAAQTLRRTLDDLIANTPADGMVVGLGAINTGLFGVDRSQAVVLAYDATVLAGTQGVRNHQKTDRMLAIALKELRPVVLFAEGGGGRPGDIDMPITAGLHVSTFASFARLNGKVPLVGVVSGRCFAGNAALLGCCDVIIATNDSNIGMGGPAMVEGGGLGQFQPEDIGPSGVQHRNGVIDVLVNSDQQAVEAAAQYLSYFQGSVQEWVAPDTQALRQLVPENRVRVYDSVLALDGLADVGSVMVLRSGFGLGIHTALARIEGRPVGFLINNPHHLGGAIDGDAADKAARFIQLCNGHGLPLVTLVDTPGFMVGPQIEALAQVRHASRLFVAGARLRVPLVSIVMRKGYGLGAMAMTGGGFHEPLATAAWPSAEFGAMGLEGAIKLGFKKELLALPEGPDRDALYQQLLAQQIERGQALAMATTLEIDQVIDPAETRDYLIKVLKTGTVKPWDGAPMIDTW